MQTGKEGRVFVKGRWNKDVMDGQIIEQLEKAKSNSEYYFTNAKMEKISDEKGSVTDASNAAVKSDAGSSDKPLVAMETPQDASKTGDSSVAAAPDPSDPNAAPAKSKKSKYSKSIY
jgi:hypothetical protein